MQQLESKALPKEGSNASGVKTPGNTPPFEDLGGPTPENYKVQIMILLN